MGVIGQFISLFTKGPAIQNLENIDMVVKMRDGGILLPVVCSKHLDESDEAINLLRTKLDTYFNNIESQEFKTEYPGHTYILIELNCVKKPDNRILEELEVLKNKYKDTVIRFSWKA